MENMEKELAHATVCYLVKDDKILLAVKARHIGQGYWNGYGGGLGLRLITYPLMN